VSTGPKQAVIYHVEHIQPHKLVPLAYTPLYPLHFSTRTGLGVAPTSCWLDGNNTRPWEGERQGKGALHYLDG
jgi:hypothetical protein